MFKRLQAAARRLKDRPELVFYALLGICLAALGLRLMNIAAEPFWGDEALSLDVVRHFSSLRDIVQYIREVEIHPPLYYVVLYYWVAWFGETELPVRLLSVVFSVATIPISYAFVKRLFNSPAAGLLTALIVALLPIQIEFGQEARPYSIFCFFAVLAAWSLWEFLRRRHYAWLAGYVLATVAGIYFHYSFGFFAVAFVLWWLAEIFFLRRTGRSRELVVWLAAHAAVFLAFWWWLDAFLYKLALSQFMFFDIERANVQTRSLYFIWDNVGRSLWLQKYSEVLPIEILAQFIVLAMAVWTVFRLAKKERAAEPPGDRLAVYYLNWLIWVPTLIFLFSPQSMPYAPIQQRHLIAVTVPIAALIAYAAVRLGRKPGAVLIALFLISLLPRISEVAGNDALWDKYFQLKAAATEINENYKAGDLVIIAWSFTRSDLNHYLRPDISAVGFLPLAVYDRDPWQSRETLGLMENESQFRIKMPSIEEIRTKFDRLDRKYRPKRVWLYGFTKDYSAVHNWFAEDSWRHAIGTVGNTLLLDMYVRK